MLVKRFAEAKAYEAPNHRNYSSLRLFFSIWVSQTKQVKIVDSCDSR